MFNMSVKIAVHLLYKKYSPRVVLPGGTALLFSGTALNMVNFGSRSSVRDIIDATFPHR